MTREETASTLKLLKAAYPAFYSKMGRNDLLAVLDVWTEMFAEEPVEIVKVALKDLLATHSGYPPDIAAVKSRIKAIMAAAAGEPSDEELWQILKKAISNGLYNFRQEYEALPSLLRRFLSDPYQLYQLAQIDAQTLNTVYHGQFLKEIKTLREREDCEKRLPEAVKAYITAAYKPMIAEKQMTPEDVNDRRNKILDAIDGR